MAEPLVISALRDKRAELVWLASGSVANTGAAVVWDGRVGPGTAGGVMMTTRDEAFKGHCQINPNGHGTDRFLAIHVLRRGTCSATLDIGEVLTRIGAICDEFECYGYRRVGAALRHQGIVANGKKLRRLMREHDLQLWKFLFGLADDRSGVVDVRLIEAVDCLCYAAFAGVCFSRASEAVSRNVGIGVLPKHHRL
jgi:HTH-like domain